MALGFLPGCEGPPPFPLPPSKPSGLLPLSSPFSTAGPFSSSEDQRVIPKMEVMTGRFFNTEITAPLRAAVTAAIGNSVPIAGLIELVVGYAGSSIYTAIKRSPNPDGFCNFVCYWCSRGTPCTGPEHLANQHRLCFYDTVYVDHMDPDWVLNPSTVMWRISIPNDADVVYDGNWRVSKYAKHEEIKGWDVPELQTVEYCERTVRQHFGQDCTADPLVYERRTYAALAADPIRSVFCRAMQEWRPRWHEQFSLPVEEGESDNDSEADANEEGEDEDDGNEGENDEDEAPLLIPEVLPGLQPVTLPGICVQPANAKGDKDA